MLLSYASLQNDLRSKTKCKRIIVKYNRQTVTTFGYTKLPFKFHNIDTCSNSTPNILGSEGPHMSISRTATFEKRKSMHLSMFCISVNNTAGRLLSSYQFYLTFYFIAYQKIGR